MRSHRPDDRHLVIRPLTRRSIIHILVHRMFTVTSALCVESEMKTEQAVRPYGTIRVQLRRVTVISRSINRKRKCRLTLQPRRLIESHNHKKGNLRRIWKEGSENFSLSSLGRKETSTPRKEAPPFIDTVANFPKFLGSWFFAVIKSAVARFADSYKKLHFSLLFSSWRHDSERTSRETF